MGSNIRAIWTEREGGVARRRKARNDYQQGKRMLVAETTDVVLYSVILLPRPWEPPLEN